MADAVFVRERNDRRVTVAAAASAGEVRQLGDGRAAVLSGLNAATSGDRRSFNTSGQYTITKTSGVVILDGQEVFWDHSANAATYKTANDRDFYLGVAVGDAASSDTQMTVDLNVEPRYLIDLQNGAWLTAVVKTAGTPDVKMRGGSAHLEFSATAEAQKVDLLSQEGFAVGSNWIVEGEFNVIDDGDATAADFSIGIANATHASDADSITESCFLHLDGNTLDLFAESDDGTTEVAATDTTINIALGTPVHFVMDGRNESDIQIYVNGALVLGATVFTLAAATGPLKLLAHLEKSSDDTPGEYHVNKLRVRIAEQ